MILYTLLTRGQCKIDLFNIYPPGTGGVCEHVIVIYIRLTECYFQLIILVGLIVYLQKQWA